MEEFGADIRSRLKGIKWKDVNDVFLGYHFGYYCFLYTGKYLGVPTLAFVCEREFVALKRCVPTLFHKDSNVWTRPLQHAFTVSPRPPLTIGQIFMRCEAKTFDLESLILPEPEHEEAPDA